MDAQANVRVLLPASPNGADRAAQRPVVFSVAPTRKPSQLKASRALIVLTRDGAREAVLPTELRSTSLDALPGYELDLSVGVRRRVIEAALAVAREPLALILVEEFDGIGNWSEIDAPPPLRLPARSPSLRDRSQTLHASAARGWPVAITVPGPEPDVPLHPAVPLLLAGDEAPLQAFEGEGPTRRSLALAARTAAFAMPAYVLKPEPLDDAVDKAIYVMTSRRAILLRTSLAGGEVAPPARHLVPIVPRMRAPAAAAVAGALSRVAGGDARVRPMSLGHIERAVLGGRAGAMFLQTDSLVSVGSAALLDRDEPRFGQRANIVAQHTRQLRGPRAGALPDTSDLARRRRTFVSQHDLVTATDGDQSLAAFRATLGPAGVFRLGDAQERVELLALAATPEKGKPESRARLRALPPTFGGRLSFRVQVASPDGEAPEDVRAVLERAGLYNPRTRAELRVGGAWSYFASVFFAIVDDETILTFAMEGEALAKAQVSLSNASADDAVEFRLVLGARALGPLPQPTGPSPLAKEALVAVPPPSLPVGPGRIVTVRLPLAGQGGPAIPSEAALVAFGDPAYDRTLSSRAQATRSSDGAWLLASDRPEYNADGELHLAFGEIDRGSAAFLRNAGPAELLLQVQRHGERGTRPPPVDLYLADASKLTILRGEPHTLALSNLATKDEKGLREPLRPGDEVILTGVSADRKLQVRVRIVAEPTTPAPDAVYGVVLRESSSRLGVPAYASAPMPQALEFADLIGDLAAGVVRRRGLFLWRFCTEGVEPGDRAVALVKVDRAGGGQLVDSAEDLSALN